MQSDHKFTFSHRDITEADKDWCGKVSNSKAIDEFFQNLGWKRIILPLRDSSCVENIENIDLEMIADLNKRKTAILPLDVDKIIPIRLASKASWTWIADFRPLSDKWLLSHYLDEFLLEKEKEYAKNIGENDNTAQKHRFHFRSWAVSAKFNKETMKDGQFTVDEVINILRKEEERASRNRNMNDWIPDDGYYVKPGGAMSGGGRAVNFVKSLFELEKYLLLWVRLRKKEDKLGAICLVQQAMSNRRRMVWHHMDGIPRFFEVRVMAVITGMEDSSLDNSKKSFFSIRQDKQRCIGLQHGSVHIFPKLRFKALPVPNSNKGPGPILLNQRRQDMANNSAHTCSNTTKSKSEMFNSYSLEDFLASIADDGRSNSWVDTKMLPQIVLAIQDTANACCYPRKSLVNGNEHKMTTGLPKGAILVNAFDFIIDTEGNPWLLEVNTKPWLRWAGVNTDVAYPHKVARTISAGVLDDLLRLIEDSKIL